MKKTTIDDIPAHEQKYVVFHNGEPHTLLNRHLAERQGVTDEQLANLVRLHGEKLKLFEQMRALNPAEERCKLRTLAAAFEQIEFDLQKNWNFTQDANFHEWYTVPHCTCPKLDNHDRKGSKFKVISQECPIHGRK